MVSPGHAVHVVCEAFRDPGGLFFPSKLSESSAKLPQQFPANFHYNSAFCLYRQAKTAGTLLVLVTEFGGNIGGNSAEFWWKFWWSFGGIFSQVATGTVRLGGGCPPAWKNGGRRSLER